MKREDVKITVSSIEDHKAVFDLLDAYGEIVSHTAYDTFSFANEWDIFFYNGKWVVGYSSVKSISIYELENLIKPKEQSPVMYLVQWIAEHPEHTQEEYIQAIVKAEDMFLELALKLWRE